MVNENLVQIPNLNDFTGHTFKFVEDYDKWLKGTKFKVWDISKYVTIEFILTFESSTEMIENEIQRIIDFNQKCLEGAETAVLLWETEPQNFTKRKVFLGTTYYRHIDGKIPYNDCDNLWNDLEYYKEKVKEQNIDLEKFTSRSPKIQKWVFDTYIGKRRDIDVTIFNQAKFKRA